jgi:hypothetical protein
MTLFKITTIVGVWGKKLGKEEIAVELTEFEVLSMMRALSRWNKTLYAKIKSELIEEAKKEGYEISFELPEHGNKKEAVR